jgi:hypothetical protein
MPSRTVSNRKRTIFGSRKLHRLYKTIMANKKLSVAIMAIITPLVGILVTSKGLPTDYFVELRKMLTATPVGKQVADWLQQLVDALLRTLGIGIQVGDVVKVRESCEGDTFLEKNTYQNSPDKDRTYDKKFMAFEFIVYRIRKRKIQLIEHDDNTKNLTRENVKEMSSRTLSENNYHILNNKEMYDTPKCINPHVPFGFSIDDFEKTSDTQLDSH